MSTEAHHTSHIVQSLAVNVTIAVGKGIAAALTGSGAMLAETLHSFADCGNQVLLLVGVRRSVQPPDESHPLGYGRALYFWSFMVALLLFTGGGVFSIYEGVHKLLEHAEEQGPGGLWLGIGMLLFSLVLEGGSTVANIREINRRRGKKRFLRYLQDTKDSDLVVVFGENSAAVVGLAFALAAVGMAHWTGDGRWDAGGSVAIGLVLVGVALFLAYEISSLLVGEAADPEVRRACEEIAIEMPEIERVLNIIALQQGPGEVMVAMKVQVASNLSAVQVVEAINEMERRLHARCPEIRWSFVEPDDHA
jgi:cation diffusion facilitator family transporter